MKMVQESQFRQNEGDIAPGAYVSVNNIRGRIVSVSGGRVKVDMQTADSRPESVTPQNAHI